MHAGGISSKRADTDKETSQMAKSTKIGEGRRKDAVRISAEIDASRVADAEYDRLFLQTTSDSSDVFLDRNSELLRRLNKLSITSSSSQSRLSSNCKMGRPAVSHETSTL